MKLNLEKISVVLATDCGSTTTKAVLFEKTKDGWRQTYRGEAPTTVEKPVADVTIGARNAFLEVQELSSRKILNDNLNEDEIPFYFRKSLDDKDGIDLYVSTSSAGGGLQIVVAGVVMNMTTESAERAALGAGAIVLDAISIDDGREQYERVQRIRHLRPDIVLIAGGTENGNLNHPLELAEIILQADPKPRFGDTLKLPVIYAANSAAKDEAEKILGNRFSFHVVENLRPSLEKENLAPAREAIHELFLHHVMSHAPGYKKLLSWSPVPIIPTPAAVGQMVLNASKITGQQILAVDIGGATTDVFSVFFAENESGGKEPIFNRTVSANLGMSYSVANVMIEAGEKNILKWLPFEISENELRDRLRNKMIRPTSIPQTMEDLILEQAVSREALRLAFEHHKRLAVGLKGAKKQRAIGDLFKQENTSLVDMFKLDLIIGSGGVLSHAPNRNSAALMLIDSYQPLGVTKLAVDSIFMMPHLGVFSTVHPEAASEIFFRDCIVPLGTVVAPSGKVLAGKEFFSVTLENAKEIIIRYGELLKIDLAPEEKTKAKLKPLNSSVNFGNGSGRELEVELSGGECGLIFDARGREIEIPNAESINAWYRQMGIAGGCGKMSKAYTPGLEVAPYKTIIKTRELPLRGKVLVKQGDLVEFSTPVLSAELAGELDIVRVADRLGYDVERVLKGMKVKVGDKVCRGDLLCEVHGLFSWFKAELKSNVDGIVEFFTESNAHLGVRQKPEQLQVDAYVSGKVIAVENEKSVNIETRGVFIQGIFGVGGEKCAEVFVLDVPEDVIIEKSALEKYQVQIKEKIIIGGSSFTGEALKYCAESGVSAVITGSISAETLRDFVGYEIGVSITGDEEVPFTLIITEGFGELAISKRIVSLARKFNGKFASVSGATQIRAGAMRPELIIPHQDTTIAKDLDQEFGILKIGSKVRVIRVPYFGMIAEVLDLPHQPQLIATGAEVRVAKVRLENNAEIYIPRANLEMI